MKSRTGKYTELELINFLQNKVDGNPISSPDILERNLYGAEEPWVIFGARTENELYFYTHLTKKNSNGKRYNRTAGAGHWKEDNGCDEISDYQKNIVCQKKNFRFKLNDRSLAENEYKWIMQEFKLKDYPPQEEQNNENELVLCRVLRCARDSSRRKPVEEKLKQKNIKGTAKRKLEKLQQENNRAPVICGLPAAPRKHVNVQLEMSATAGPKIKQTGTVIDAEEINSEGECKELDIEGFTNDLKSQYVEPDEEQEASLVENTYFMDDAGRGDYVENNKTVVYKNWITGCELIPNNESVAEDKI